MRTIAFLNLKGGVAKTATTVNTAAILAGDYGRKVLVVDADSQANSSEFLGMDRMPVGTLAELLRGKPDGGVRARSCIIRSNLKNVDLLPADDTLMDLDLTKVEDGRIYTGCLRDLQAFIGGRYDFMLIDCPPAFNAAAAAALIAADEVIIPIKLDAFSLRGMGNLMRQIENMRRINPALRLGGLLPTMWYKSDNVEQAEEQLRASGLPVYPHIRRTPKVDDMTFKQEPLTVSSPKSAACIDYRRFVRGLLKEVQDRG